MCSMSVRRALPDPNSHRIYRAGYMQAYTLVRPHQRTFFILYCLTSSVRADRTAVRACVCAYRTE